jgi:hypothetical protein
MGWNPVYQGRNVAQYNTTHEVVKIEEQPAKSLGEVLPEGPCGTEPKRV